ncbi:Plasmid stabilization protein [Nitrospira tepida]|uniref:Plasmid stabilization protein n=1 Tax=Nitrospira tepida TaxID=2973512 RepID=A0AA86MYL0_9BACT|nr:type II toxin-antitoxin system RelE/ParE family toxin [Nitrospira tepida]CAI4031442.1 Plasmid stabilization protein [Nitrospira tepida]
MKYKIEFKPRAIKDLKTMSLRERERVVAKVEALQTDLAGDVKRLTNFTPEYRLRVGDYRVLFQVEDDRVMIFRVLPRDKAYR